MATIFDLNVQHTHDGLWFRIAAAEDAPELTRIVHGAFEEYRDRLDPPSGAHNESSDKIRSLLRTEQAVIAGHGAAAVGCVFYHLRPDEVYLHRLAVLPAARRCGFGRALMSYVETSARLAGCTRVRLGVRLQLPANQAFYARLGYRVLSYEAHAGYDHPTFVYMVKDIADPPVRRIEVAPPDARWPEQFRAEATLLRLIFGGNLVDIHHIGSTSIPGMYAKPIIDMAPIVHDLAAVDELSGVLADVGYTALGENGLPGRRYFRKGGRRHTHHVHVYRQGNPAIERHLALRDFLRAHPARAAAYSDLKRSLAALYPQDIDAYSAGKDGLVNELLAEALAWRGRA